MVLSLVSLLVAFLVFALVCWIISMVPLPAPMAPFRNVMYIIMSIIVIIWLLGDVGVFGGVRFR